MKTEGSNKKIGKSGDIGQKKGLYLDNLVLRVDAVRGNLHPELGLVMAASIRRKAGRPQKRGA